MTAEEARVEQVLKDYIDGTYHADTDKLHLVFHPQCRMSGYLGDQCMVGDIQPFLEDLAVHPPMSEMGSSYQAEIKQLHVTGPIAEAIILETGFFDTVSIKTYFHLIRENNIWQVIAKTFTTI